MHNETDGDGFSEKELDEFLYGFEEYARQMNELLKRTLKDATPENPFPNGESWLV